MTFSHHPSTLSLKLATHIQTLFDPWLNNARYMPDAMRSSDQYRGYRHPFLFGIHYLGGVGDSPRTLTELAMIQFSWQIRRSFEWWKIYKDEHTRLKWKEDALRQTFNVLTPSAERDVRLSLEQINYVLDELEGYDILRDGSHQVSCFERIWESEAAFEPVITNALINLLDNVSNRTETPHEEVTAEIIDHKLYPLVYNRTLVAHNRLSGRVYQPVPPPTSPDVMYATSRRFACLPTDVFVSEENFKNPIAVKFMSYVNNLHPAVHQDLYRHMEMLLESFVPLFEHTLTDLHRNNPLVPRISGCCRYTEWDEPDPPDFSDDEEGWTSYESEMRQWTLTRPITLPDVPGQGYGGGLEKRRHTVSLRNRSIQVIVNVSKINLTPGGPQFPGSPWHVEGMRAERIVACGFYFLSSENITDTTLQFRMAVTFPRGFSAGDTGATLRTWGFRDGDSSHQYIGSVQIRPGLNLVFPNIYQHRQTPFQLADPSKEGHLKIVKFFLVDPDIKPIISTSLVAPQQQEWIHKAMDDNLDSKLPFEVVEMIMQNVNGLMTAEEAERYRKQLIDETDRFTHANNSYHFCIPFDIWNGPEP